MSQIVEAGLLDVDLPAEPRSASRARRAVLEALKGVAVDRDAVAMVVTEAVTNAVVHAYRGGPGTVHLDARVDGAGVHITVTDHGVGLRPRPDSPGAGLGLPLITDLADRVEFVPAQPGTTVQAHFALRGPRGPRGGRTGWLVAA
ncbi:MAG TPA: ATP-binding protein [Solirubrobacter sp.]|nr:ATP-binding protein [Solirubrobacter sp.]